jgi:TPR repeat protein
MSIPEIKTGKNLSTMETKVSNAKKTKDIVYEKTSVYLKSKNYEQVIVCLKQMIVDDQNPYAMVDYGRMLLYGLGEKKDEEKGFEWIKEASLYNIDYAYFELALCFTLGAGTNTNDVEAFKMLQKCLELNKNHCEALTMMGKYYETGILRKFDNEIKIDNGKCKFDLEAKATKATKATKASTPSLKKEKTPMTIKTLLKEQETKNEDSKYALRPDQKKAFFCFRQCAKSYQTNQNALNYYNEEEEMKKDKGAAYYYLSILYIAKPSFLTREKTREKALYWLLQAADVFTPVFYSCIASKIELFYRMGVVFNVDSETEIKEAEKWKQKASEASHTCNYCTDCTYFAKRLASLSFVASQENTENSKTAEKKSTKVAKATKPSDTCFLFNSQEFLLVVFGLLFFSLAVIIIYS